MKKILLLPVGILLLVSCEWTEKAENSRGIPGPEKVEALAPDLDAQEDSLRRRGYQTSRYQDEDSTYLIQQYFMAFLKVANNNDANSTQQTEQEQEYRSYLQQMVTQGHVSLAGPLHDDAKIQEVIIFNTPTLKEADSLARLNPLVSEGNYSVEVYPWWASKGAKLN